MDEGPDNAGDPSRDRMEGLEICRISARDAIILCLCRKDDLTLYSIFCTLKAYILPSNGRSCGIACLQGLQCPQTVRVFSENVLSDRVSSENVLLVRVFGEVVLLDQGLFARLGIFIRVWNPSAAIKCRGHCSSDKSELVSKGLNNRNDGGSGWGKQSLGV